MFGRAQGYRIVSQRRGRIDHDQYEPHVKPEVYGRLIEVCASRFNKSST